MSPLDSIAGGCASALIVAFIACSSGCASVPAPPVPAPPAPSQESPCVAGPLEIDRDKIAAAIASLPRVSTKPSRERQSPTKPDVWVFADGVVSEGGGGLPAPYREGASVGISGRVEYDATKYLARSVETEATLRGNHLVDERHLIVTVRPTVEQARDIACLINQLVNPPASMTKQEPTEAPTPPGEIVVTAHKREFCENEYTDGHWESFQLRVGGAPAGASKALSCGDALSLEDLLSRAVGAAFLNR